MPKAYHVSPIGEFRYAWLNKPDTEYNENGLYHTELVLSGKEAEEFKALVDQAAQSAFDGYTEEMTPGERKKWSIYHPYEVEEDDDGNPTGYIAFHFKQNATIPQKDGSRKSISIELRDAKDKKFDAQVFSGSEGRIMYSFRSIPITSAKQVGVRMDFFKVQVTELKTGSGGAGFGAVDGGYVADEETPLGNESEGDY